MNITNLHQPVYKTLSVRLSLIVVSAMALLLMATLGVMLYFARKSLREEAVSKAAMALEATVQHIDNILLSVEQSSGNIYHLIAPALDKPDLLLKYSRKIVETNPYVTGCAIALRPYYYKDVEHFMAYVRLNADSVLVQADSFGDRPYTEQSWYTVPMTLGRPKWLNPLQGMDVDEEPIFTFSLPIYTADGSVAGVVGIDVSLSQLSQRVLATKPSPNSYCTLLADDGSFIVHPDSTQLLHHVAEEPRPKGEYRTMMEAVREMVAGKTGYRPFRKDGKDYYVFFKPFERENVQGRTDDMLGWSAGIVCPKDDIVGHSVRLSRQIILLALAGLLLLFVLSRFIIHRQLKPLRALASSAHHIAQGHYDEPIADSRQADEIGQLQDNFRLMQQSMSKHVSDLEEMKTTLEERGRTLRATYTQARKADRMKMAFLHNVTNRMLAPAEALVSDVNVLSDPEVGQQRIAAVVDDIRSNSDAIAAMLNEVLDMSEKDMGKEDGHA